jgi:predicted RNase H-related nuclease YkuK (DUF458 family)
LPMDSGTAQNEERMRMHAAKSIQPILDIRNAEIHLQFGGPEGLTREG